jgi:hypothetical protein
MFDVRKSLHHHTIRIIQTTRCNSFTSLLLNVYVWLNMFRASPRPSSGAYNCTRSLWFYRWRAVAGAMLVVVWQVCQTRTNNTSAASLQPKNQRLLVQLYAPDDGRGDAQNMLSHTYTSSNKLVKMLHLVGWMIRILLEMCCDVWSVQSITMFK